MKRLLSTKITGTLFIFGILLLTLISMTTYWQIQKLVKANTWVSHTYEVIEKSQRILLSILYMDLQFQKYFYTNHPINVSALSSMTLSHFQTVRKLTHDNSGQQRRLDLLEPVVMQKINLLNEGVKDTSIGLLVLNEKKTLQIMAMIEEFKNEELRLLKVRNDYSSTEAMLTRIMILIAVMVGDLLLLLTFFLIHQQNKQLRIAEHNQAELTTRYTRIIDSSKDLIAAIDKNYNYIAFNQAYAKKFHEIFNIHIQIGDNLKEVLISYTDKSSWILCWKRALQGEEFVVTTSLGKTQEDDNFYEVSYNTIRDKNSQIIAATHIMRDITARMKIDNLKSEFVSIVSHELRTPLTSIRGSLSLVLAETLGKLNQPMQKLLHIASHNCDRLVILIYGLLDIEKFEKGKIQLNLKLTDINEVVEEAVLENKAYGEKCSVKISLEKHLLPIIAEVDPQRIRQVLDNLISNAIKFSSENSEIKVIVSLALNDVKVSVVDHGEGVPENFRSIIFQKFAQADSSATRQRGGTGLGLSISKAIIEKHSGKIGFISIPDQETQFYFELPIYSISNTRIMI